MSFKKITIIYDKECPVCDKYCQIIRIKDCFGKVEIINARENIDYINKITNKKFDINKGMIVLLNNQLYFGFEAIHVLALISSRSGVINKLNYIIFSSKFLSKLLYPVLRFSRYLLLFIMGKKAINNINLNKKDNKI